jgi:CubicO group peptidase (beta-lactamase class C family)
MVTNVKSKLKALLAAMTCVVASHSHASTYSAPQPVREVVDEAIHSIMQQYGVPGMAVGLTVGGKHYFFNYGVASKDNRDPVSRQTLFEVGSFSKTVTATLACYAAENGKLSWSDSAGQHLPQLRGSSLDKVSLLNLGTHTSGLPLFVPDSITNDEQLMSFLRDWKPGHPVGSYRVYSNAGIGTLGLIAASSMNQPFDDAVQRTLLPALGMTHTYIDVPADQMKDYAQGYNKNDAPVRLNPGELASEAYGIKSSTSDLVRFLDINMRLAPVDERLQRAIACTHTGYYAVGPFIQDLMWEQYPYPVALNTLLAGNSPDVIYKGMAAAELTPPLQPQPEALLNKTGSTNGFSTYAAFVPARKMGVVILANKSYPIDARVTAAYKILMSLLTSSPG